MSLERLHHFNIVTRDVEGTAAWFARTIGLHPGPRPPLAFHGVWMYLGDTPVVHVAAENPNAHITGEDPHADRGTFTGPIDHIAFVGNKFDEFRAGLIDKKVEHFHVYLEDIKLNQLFLRDPNGILIEINFPN
jgi:catechol 2,3-dioxygenase-like lactoylglutathione lyase family enzyme